MKNPTVEKYHEVSQMLVAVTGQDLLDLSFKHDFYELARTINEAYITWQPSQAYPLNKSKQKLLNVCQHGSPKMIRLVLKNPSVLLPDLPFLQELEKG